MLVKRLVATCGMLAWLTAPAWAGTIQDPDAQIDAGSASNPFSGLGSFNPTGDPGTPGIIALFNDTHGLLTSITLTTDIDPALTYAIIDASTISLDGIHFGCNNASSGNPFFLDCGVTYAYAPGGTFGVLTISFFGVNQYIPGAEPGDLLGLHEGIPPVPPACLPDPDVQCPTSDVGHFTLNFLSLETNGWPLTSTEDAVFLDDTVPTFAPPAYTDAGTPEPGTSTLLAVGLLWLALLDRKSTRLNS